jgi:hypothetical protein
MAKYPAGEVDACELEKKILVAALKLKAKEYLNKAKEAYSEQHHWDQDAYWFWDHKASEINKKIAKIAQMPCNMIDGFAEDEGIDLPDIVRRYYPGMLDDQDEQHLVEGMAQFLAHLRDAADILMNFQDRSGEIINGWHTYIDHLTDFSPVYSVDGSGKMIAPWYEDQQKSIKFLQDQKAGLRPDISDRRIPQVIEYENTCYEYFKWLVEQGGEMALSRLMYENGKRFNQMISDHAGESITPDYSVQQIKYFTQCAALRRFANWVEIAQMCMKDMDDKREHAEV